MLVIVTFRTATVTGNTDRVFPSTLGISLRLSSIDYADYGDYADYADSADYADYADYRRPSPFHDVNIISKLKNNPLLEYSVRWFGWPKATKGKMGQGVKEKVCHRRGLYTVKR